MPGKSEIRGLLASSWDISEDGLVYTFHLVEGATFHDGAPFNADAVVTSFLRRKDGDLILSYFLWNMRGIEATDDKTVVLTLGMPQPSLLDSLGSPWGPKVISPAALAEHAGDDNATSWLDSNAVGTRPFKLASFARGEGYSLERFDAYHGEPAFFDVVKLPPIPEISQQVLNLQAPEIRRRSRKLSVGSGCGPSAGIEITSAPSTSLIIGFVNRTPFSTIPTFAPPSSPWSIPKAGLPTHTAPMATQPGRSIHHHARTGDAADFPERRSRCQGDGCGQESDCSDHWHLRRRGQFARPCRRSMMAELAILPSGAAFGLMDNPDGPDFYMGKLTPDALHPENQASI